ncbi:MAG TPA: metallophosphoesterase [Candidatus Alistipes intestinipullorum]|nr:metallophosphoesterase [Candidatus Alistipes intestinipullorum]
MKRFLSLLIITCSPLWAWGQFSYDGDSACKPFSAAPSVSGAFRFAVIADRCGGERPGVFRQGAERVREYDPDFVVSIGDLIDGYTTDRAYATRQWEEFETLRQLFGAPLFYTPGNHDYSNAVLAALWNERFGCSYYSFRIGASLFLILNSEEKLENGRTGISDVQAEYFLRVLAQETSGAPMFVVMHTPLWFTGTDSNYNRLEEQFLRRNVTVFSGHTHRYYHADKCGRPHYNLATMGGDSRMRGVSMGEFDHFLVVDVCDGKSTIRNVSVDGTLLPLDAVDEQSRVPVEQLAEEQWLHVVPTVSREARTDALATDLVLSNPSELPLLVSFEAPRLPGIRFEPERFSHEVAGNSSDTISLRILFDQTRQIDDLPPLVVTCRGTYRIAGREVSAPASKRWLVDCIRTCGTEPIDLLVDDPLYVHESWDWHSVADGSFRFEVSQVGSRIELRIETMDDHLITNADPRMLQDRLVVLFTPEGGPTRRVELAAGTAVDDAYRAECHAIENGLEAQVSFPSDGIRLFNLNIGFVDCDNVLNTKPSQLWWRPLDKHANAHADYGTFLVDPYH